MATSVDSGKALPQREADEKLPLGSPADRLLNILLETKGTQVTQVFKVY